MKTIGNKLIVKLDKSGEQLLPSGIISISNERKYTGVVVSANDRLKFKEGDSVEIETHAYDKCIDKNENLFVVYDGDIVRCNGKLTGSYVVAKLDYNRWKYKSISGMLIERRNEINYTTDNNHLGKHRSETVCTFATIAELSDEAKENGFNEGDHIVYDYGYGLEPFKRNNEDHVKVPCDKILCKYSDGNIYPQKGWNFAVKLKEKRSDLAVHETELKKQYEIVYSSNNSTSTEVPADYITSGTKVIADEYYKIDLPDDKTYSLISDNEIYALIKDGGLKPVVLK